LAALQHVETEDDLLAVRKTLSEAYLHNDELDAARKIWSMIADSASDQATELRDLVLFLDRLEQWDDAIAYAHRRRDLEGQQAASFIHDTILLGDLEAHRHRITESLRDYQEARAALSPDNTLTQSVDDKIEKAYRQNHDLTGLAEYYEGLLKQSDQSAD